MNELVIALLTYNRPGAAENLIEAICPVIEDFNGVELLVIENFSSSTIKTSIINTVRATYFLKKPNRGLDSSIIQALYYAKYKKKHIWFLCDDDNLYVDKLPFILSSLCNSSFDLTYVPWYAPNGSLPKINTSVDAYIRMSFLPTIACNPDNINLSKLRSLVGSNYLHIGLLNLFFSTSNINFSLEDVAGIQSRNYSTRFPVFETFVTGYQKALDFNSILSTADISKLMYSRTYSSLSYFKNQQLDFLTFMKYLRFALIESRVNIFKKAKFLTKLFFSKCF